MKMFWNPETLITAVTALLVADSVLAGSSYLGSSSKVYSRRSPSDASGANIVIDMIAGPPSMTQQYTGQLRVFCLIDLLSNGQIDGKGEKILARCEELLNDAAPVVDGMTCQPLVSLGVTPGFVDPEDRSRSRGALRLNYEIGPNT